MTTVFVGGALGSLSAATTYGVFGWGGVVALSALLAASALVGWASQLPVLAPRSSTRRTPRRPPDDVLSRRARHPVQGRRAPSRAERAAGQPLYCSTSSRLSTLPDGPSGKASVKNTRRGYL